MKEQSIWYAFVSQNDFFVAPQANSLDSLSDDASKSCYPDTVRAGRLYPDTTGDPDDILNSILSSGSESRDSVLFGRGGIGQSEVGLGVPLFVENLITPPWAKIDRRQSDRFGRLGLQTYPLVNIDTFHNF